MGPFIIEFYYGGDCIESRSYEDVVFEPQVGDVVRIDFQNRNYSDVEGNWWKVTERRILFFDVNTPNLKQTLMLNVQPDTNHGMWKTDPAYK